MGSLKYSITFVEKNAGYESLTEEELTETAEALKEYIKDILAVRFNTERETIQINFEAVQE